MARTNRARRLTATSTASPAARVAPELPRPRTEPPSDPPSLPLLGSEQTAEDELFWRAMTMLNAAGSRADSVKATDEIMAAFEFSAGLTPSKQSKQAPCIPTYVLVLIKLWELFSILQLCEWRVDLDAEIDFLVAMFAPIVSFQLWLLGLIWSGFSMIGKDLAAYVDSSTERLKAKIRPGIIAQMQPVLSEMSPLFELLYLAVIYGVVRPAAFVACVFTRTKRTAVEAPVKEAAVANKKKIEGEKPLREQLARLPKTHPRFAWIHSCLERMDANKSEDEKSQSRDTGSIDEATPVQSTHAASSPAHQLPAQEL